MEDMFEDLKTRRTAKQELADKEAGAAAGEEVADAPRVFPDATGTAKSTDAKAEAEDSGGTGP